MMMIDLTAQLSPLATVLNVLLVVAGAAIVAKALAARTAFSVAETRNGIELAVVGSSSSAPSRKEEAPSDDSIPEAA